MGSDAKNTLTSKKIRYKCHLIALIISARLMHLYPHVINRQLCGVKLLSQWHVRLDCDLFLRDILKLDLMVNDAEEIVNSISQAYKLCPMRNNSDDISGQTEITIRELLPKELQRFPVLTEVVLIGEKVSSMFC